MSVSGWFPAIVGVVVAAITAVFAYWNSRRLSEREARLGRVSAQLEELYGPALALAEASTISWKTFVGRYLSEVRQVRDATEFVEPAANLWMIWMKTVFMPANRAIRELIVSKTHLLDGDEMPAEFLVFLAHVSGYEVVLSRWEAGDYEQLVSIIDHPGDPFLEHLRSAFSQLKQRQQSLLGAD